MFPTRNFYSEVTYFATINAEAEQIVGRERRERVSQLAWCGAGCFDSRRRVNSNVRPIHNSKRYDEGCCVSSSASSDRVGGGHRFDCCSGQSMRVNRRGIPLLP